MSLAFPILVAAEQPLVKRDELAIANSWCAAFYSVVQRIVRPEARLEYEKKLENHLRYAKGLHESSEAQPTRFQKDIALQASALGEAKSDDAKRSFFRNGMLRCNTIESHTPLIVKEHNLSMSDK